MATLNAALISELMHQACAQIFSAAAKIEAHVQAYLSETRSPADLCEVLDRAHFTVAQQRNLARLAKRLQALSPDTSIAEHLPPNALSANDILKTLSRVADALPGWHARS